ncbi:hypothetical protein [Roseateles violae]|uniref:Uncharacterized protein n=1 Tax=Roseateles violae TaxID=3058042 RepID=A0ABT8DN77_9BURK|nr:hypothetical protein [Pelomonas sp. PFR6]MDN3919398.1 hypothetical protein [Pelomonas sp. PFR6]
MRWNKKLGGRLIALSGMSAALAATMVACGGSDGESAPPPPVTQEPQAPAAPPAPALAERIAARIHYFGAENVDAATGEVRTDLVIMSWASNTTYAAAINGKVVLMDASLVRREQAPGRTPTTLTEMVALMPSYVLLGKAAPGHADLAADIAFRTGATVVGAQEHCDAVEADARRQKNWTGSAKLLKCQAVVPKDHAVGASVAAVNFPDLNVCLRAVKNTDQAVTAPDPTLAQASFDWSKLSDPRDAKWWPVGTAATDGVTTTGAATGAAVAYHLTIGQGRSFGLVWNDRVGSLKELAPTVASLLRALPKTDVHIGSVDVGNAASNGLRDAALYIEAVKPKLFVAAGHDAASQRAGAFNTGELMRRALETAIANVGIAQSPILRINFDPTDYLRPHYMTFDPAAAGWNQTGDKPTAAACS